MYTFLIATSINIYFIASDYHYLSERYNPVRKAPRMRIYDITQTIRNGMPVWPGDPEVRLNWLSQISQGGLVNLTEIHMCAHAGTHIDMPSHFLDQGQNLDDLDLNILIGRARVVSVPPEVKVINAAFLATVAIEGVERVLFKTANSELVKAAPILLTKTMLHWMPVVPSSWLKQAVNWWGLTTCLWRSLRIRTVVICHC